ncbi:unnamed protein product [Ectocarpus sp. 6 AP-2014]
MLPSLPAASKFTLAVLLVGTWYGNVSSTSVEGGVTEATLSPVSAPARNEAITSEGWTTLILDGGTKRQTVMVRNDADETEVVASIAEGGREAGMTEPQIADVTAKWKLVEIWDNPRGVLNEQVQEGSLSLLTSIEHKRSTTSWNDQDKFNTKKFFLPTQYSTSSLSGDSSARACAMNDDHKKMLTHVDVWKGASKTMPRIFCGIFTHRKNHFTKVKAIKETWAVNCDGFVAFSDAADPDLHTFQIEHEGPEEYGNMWQKSRAIWKYINFHYKNDFDWFLLGGDDLFVIVENLRKYLLSDEIMHAAGGVINGGPNPMYLGRRLRPFNDDEWIFNSGGASYVLNQASVGLLASNLDEDTCQPHKKTSWEDVMVAMCLKKNGVVAFDTRDASGRERFHPYTPAVHFGYRTPMRPEDRLVSGIVVGDWYIGMAIDLIFGLEGCSSDSISFHYVDEDLMRRLYHLVYSCGKNPADAVVQAPHL